MGDAIRGDRVHSDDYQGKGPTLAPTNIRYKIEAGQYHQAPAAAEERPGRRPDAFDDRANARPAKQRACAESDQSGNGKPSDFEFWRAVTAKDAACNQPKYHRGQSGNKAEGGISAAVKSERFLTRKQVQKPGVESPCQIAVLVPVRRKPSPQMRPVLRHPNLRIIKRSRQGIERERRPIAGQNHREGYPMVPSWPQRQQEKKHITQTNLAESILERPVGLRTADRSQKDSQQNEREGPPQGVQDHSPA